MIASRLNLAAWVTDEAPKELRKFLDVNVSNIAYDVVEAPAFLVSSTDQLRVAEERYPAIRFHAMREHGGQVFADKV